MPQKRTASELEQRLSSDVLSRAEKGKKFDAVGELARRFVRESEERTKMERKHREKTYLKMARILFVPVLLFACTYLIIIVGSGLFLGEITNISRYSNQSVSLRNDPVMFWITVAYHSAIASLFSLGAFKLGSATKWFVRRAPNIPVDSGASRRSP